MSLHLEAVSKVSVSLDLQGHMAAGTCCLTSAYCMTFLSYLSGLDHSNWVSKVIAHNRVSLLTNHISFVLRTAWAWDWGVHSLLQPHRPRIDEHLVANLMKERLDLSLDE
jgi:hypothetical protein